MQHVSCDSKDNPEMTRVCMYVCMFVCVCVCNMASMRYELYGESTTLSHLGVIPYSLELHYQEGERLHKQRRAKALLSSVTQLTREKSCVKHIHHIMPEQQPTSWKKNHRQTEELRRSPHICTPSYNGAQISGLAHYSSAFPLFLQNHGLRRKSGPHALH